jgi:hypothetical protein
MEAKQLLRVLAVCLAVMCGSANAGIVSHSPNVEIISPPASVELGQLESDDKVRVFKESTRTLATALSVDGILAGTYPSIGCASCASIAAGTLVSSFLFHTDPVGASTVAVPYSASVTFDTDILGVIYESFAFKFNENFQLVEANTLLSSDPVLGSLTTTYPRAFTSDSSSRGFELGVCGVDTADCVTVSEDRRTVLLNWSTSQFSDQLRVIVSGEEPVSVPLPTTAALLGFGLVGIGAARRKQA